jgi:hypothetical protein
MGDQSMTQDEIIELARQAGFFVKDSEAYSPSVQEDHELTPYLESFAKLIAEREQSEPVAFKIYKPTPPRHATPNVRDAELPWVYDQDPLSGNVASMWVTPVQALRSKT